MIKFKNNRIDICEEIVYKRDIFKMVISYDIEYLNEDENNTIFRFNDNILSKEYLIKEEYDFMEIHDIINKISTYYDRYRSYDKNDTWRWFVNKVFWSDWERIYDKYFDNDWILDDFFIITTIERYNNNYDIIHTHSWYISEEYYIDKEWIEYELIISK